MILGLRGIMDEDGDIHIWPTAAWDHNDFFGSSVGRLLGRNYRARFRQWKNEAGAAIDFDPGVTPDDKKAVEEFIAKVQG